MSFSQDIHFSQFYASPFNLNPGLAGAFDRDDAFNPCDSTSRDEQALPFQTDHYLRLTANQRTQWRSVTLPYSTWGFAADGFPMKKYPQFAAAVSFYTDKTGDSRLRSTILNVVGSYRLYVTNDKRTTLVPAMSIGFSSYQIDYSDLNYDNQWNGFSFDPNSPHGESFARDARTNLNIHIGAVFTKYYTEEDWLEAGLSLFNLNNAKQSWFNDAQVKLDQRINVHVGYHYTLDPLWSVTPRILFMTQGSYYELDLGGEVEYILNDQAFAHQSVYGGLFFRTGDAGFIVAGLKQNQWDVGISYDINLSDLRPASNSRGGFEFSVVYILQRIGAPCIRYKHCPDFL